MGDVHIPKPAPNKVGAKVQELIESGHELYATAATGQPQGRVRRPTLFIIALVGCGLGPTYGIAALIGLIAILLLALTDQVVDL
jgi:hypothetical protein